MGDRWACGNRKWSCLPRFVPLSNGLYKTECTIPRGPWRNAADLEIATATWVEFYNKLRLHGSLNRMAPAEFEAAYWEAHQ